MYNLEVSKIGVALEKTLFLLFEFLEFFPIKKKKSYIKKAFPICHISIKIYSLKYPNYYLARI